MKKINFVLSRQVYNLKKDAETALTGRLNGGEKLGNYRLYEVVKTYKPVIKFKEIK